MNELWGWTLTMFVFCQIDRLILNCSKHHWIVGIMCIPDILNSTISLFEVGLQFKIVWSIQGPLRTPCACMPWRILMNLATSTWPCYGPLGVNIVFEVKCKIVWPMQGPLGHVGQPRIACALIRGRQLIFDHYHGIPPYSQRFLGLRVGHKWRI